MAAAENKRNTVQRQLVLHAVARLNNHATAEQVYEHVRCEYPSISKATVYRNLSQMAAAGELLKIGSLDGSSHYDHNCHEHYHFICELCRRVFDIDDYFPDLCARVKKEEGFELTGHALTFFGRCPDCQPNRRQLTT